MGMTLLLTGCINPQGMAYTALQDSQTRFLHYQNALNWYLENALFKIVFVENSNFDISPYFEDAIKRGKLEVLTFDGNNYDVSLGKGFGEAGIIKFALEHSAFLIESDVIIKVSGRYICKNINKFLKAYNNKETVYTIPALDDRNNIMSQSRVIVWPKGFVKNYFLSRMTELNDSKHFWFEHLLYDATQQWVSDGHRYKEMWIPPILEGVGGSSGFLTKDRGALIEYTSFYLKYILHRFHIYAPLRFWSHPKELAY